MLVQDIIKKTEGEFAEKYANFREFQYDVKYRAYWDKCMEAISNRDLLLHIVFANNLFEIPPVKTFLLYYRKDFTVITGRPDARLDDFVKKGIGAFWGMVFRFVLDYQDKKSVSVSMSEFFGVKTATCFGMPRGKITLE
ncbi:MAG: hypothetical protein LBT08_07685 [Synergistaceae bacterium]|jgi:hypothetical protein|nr:hypothetical protein [Synergistaceae bacterium]